MLALLAVLSRRTGLTTEDLLRRYGEFLFSRFGALYPGFSNTRKILFVADEPRVLSGLRRRLFGRFATVTAASPAEALRTLETTPDIAVIVADMRMLEMSGIELLGVIRSRWPEIRRIMLTGNTA